MENSKLISIIIPIYKVEKYLDRCVQSVVNQTYKNLEIILVNDGSPDNCPQICDEWASKDNRIKVIHKSNGGVSSARNEGLKNVTGEYVVFIDADDYVSKDFLQNLISVANNEQVDIVISGFTIVDDKGNKKLVSKQEVTELSIDNIDCFMDLVVDGFFDISCNKLYKAKLIKNAFKEGLPLGEDRIFNLDYFKEINNKVIINNSTGYFYISNPTSACHKKRKNIYNILVVSHDELGKFLDFKYRTHQNNKFYGLIANFAVNVITQCLKEDRKDTYKKLCNNELFKESIIKYKPKGIKEKVKLFLLKHKMFGLIRMITKILY